MSFFAPIAQLAGAGVQAGGALAAGGTAAAVDTSNAQTAAINAGTALQAGQTNAAIVGQNTALAQGRAAAAFGASGVEMSGSPLAVMASLAATGELQRRLAVQSGTLQAAADTRQSQIDRAQAGAASEASDIKAGGTLLTGAGNYAQTTRALGWWAPQAGAAGTSPAAS